MTDLGNLTMQEIKARLDGLDRIKEVKRNIQKRYYHNHNEKIREYAREKAKEYYDKRKDDPEFRKKKLENTLKSIQRKKEKMNEQKQEEPEEKIELEPQFI